MLVLWLVFDESGFQFYCLSSYFEKGKLHLVNTNSSKCLVIRLFKKYWILYSIHTFYRIHHILIRITVVYTCDDSIIFSHYAMPFPSVCWFFVCVITYNMIVITTDTQWNAYRYKLSLLRCVIVVDQRKRPMNISLWKKKSTQSTAKSIILPTI